MVKKLSPTTVKGLKRSDHDNCDYNERSGEVKDK
jgi:hypothetical protein